MAAPGIIGFLSSSVDNALNTFVYTTSAAVSVAITPLVVTGMTIWVTTYGLAVMRNEVNDPVNVFVKNIIKTSLILSIALGAGIYQSYIVDGVNALQQGFTSMVVPSGATDIYTVLDNYDNQSTQLALVIIGHGMLLLPLGGYLDIVAGLIVMAATAIMIIMSAGFLLVAKVAMAMMLGLGPVFIASLAFPPIAKFFDAWMGKVMNYVFLMVGLAITLSISVAICAAYISNFNTTQGATNNIADAFGLVVLHGSLIILIYQMPNIASGLGGGASISGGGLGAFVGGMMMGRGRGSGGGGGTPSNNNSIQNESAPPPAPAANSRTPAYRRATLDRMNND